MYLSRDIACGTALHTEIANPIPVDVAEDLKTTIFNKFCSVKFLESCKRAATQNRNEGFNSHAWSFVPKERYASSFETTLGINLAVSSYNDGFATTLANLFEKGGISVCEHSLNMWRKIDTARVNDAEYKVRNVTLTLFSILCSISRGRAG